MKRATTSKEAQRLGLLFFKSRSNGTYCLCKELKNYDFKLNPLGLKVVFASAKLKPANNEPSLFAGFVS